MTIINLFKRYERWNPVHPTYGAFWGIGFGFGCGVGWGPGFGPEVIGYVGSGCGIGWSVGLTMLGVGVGLPAGGLASVPSDVLCIASSSLLQFTKSSAAPAASRAARRGWVGALQVSSRLRTVAASRFKQCELKTSREWQNSCLVALGTLKCFLDNLSQRKVQHSGLKASSGDSSTELTDSRRTSNDS